MNISSWRQWLGQHPIWWLLLAALGLRLVGLDKNPIALNWDEVSHGYNAYSIWQTGKDEWGQAWPLIFRAYGDYKLPVYIYLLSPLVGLLGLTAWAVRLPSALAGTASVGLTYLTAKQLLAKSPWSEEKKQLTALLAGLLVAINPWTVFLSRTAVEANLAASFNLLAVWAWLKALSGSKTKSPWPYLLLASVAWSITLFTYNSFRVFTPLLILLWCLPVLSSKFRLKKLRRWLPQYPSLNWSAIYLLPATVFLLSLSLMLYQMIGTNAGLARAQKISALDQGTVNRIIERRLNSRLPAWGARLIHNRPVTLAGIMVKNHLSHFDPRFWYLSGSHNRSFQVDKLYLLYPINLLFLLYGLTKFRQLPPTTRYLLLTWVLLAPLPAAPTRDTPHVLRIIPLLPVMQILTAWGVVYFVTRAGKINLARLRLYLLILLVGLIHFQAVYWLRYRFQSAPAWQYGNQQLVAWLKSQYPQYPEILVTKRYGEIHEFIAFYWPWDVADFQTNKQWDYHAQWYWVNQLGKFKFINDWEMKSTVEKLPADRSQPYLAVTTIPPEQAPANWTIKYSLYYPRSNQLVYAVYQI